jgi:DNA primase
MTEEASHENDWTTIPEAINRLRGYYDYDSLYRLVKRSGIETRRRGKYLTFRLADLWAWQERRQFFESLADARRGDWYTRARLREQEQERLGYRR